MKILFVCSRFAIICFCGKTLGQIVMGAIGEMFMVIRLNEKTKCDLNHSRCLNG